MTKAHLEIISHPAAKCREAARLYREWCASVMQIPGGTFVADEQGNLSDDQLREINRLVTKDSGDGEAYRGHVANCDACKGE